MLSSDAPVGQRNSCTNCTIGAILNLRFTIYDLRTQIQATKIFQSKAAVSLLKRGAGYCGCLMAAAVMAQNPSSGWVQNWPQWRGPLASGAGPEADPPMSWSETENVRWKVAIPGYGTSTPIVWGDKVFV